METKVGLKAGGYFTVECYGEDGKLKWKERPDNIVVNEGLNHLLNVLLHGTTPVDPWYVGIFEGNYAPVASDTAASLTGNATECTAFTEGVRQIYNEAAASAQSITNSANKATFSINAGKTIYGAFLQYIATLGATTGTLLCAAKFGSARAVISGDQILVTYTISATSA